MKRNSKRILIMVMLIGGGLYATQYFLSWSTTYSYSSIISSFEGKSSEPVKFVIIENLRVKKDINQFARDADSIVIGKVESISPAYRDKVDNIVYRDVALHIENYFKNPQPTDQLTVKIYGGRINNTEFIWEHQPNFYIGEQVLLFLGTNASKDFVVYAGDHGKFTLDKDIAHGSKDEVISKPDLLEKINRYIN